MCVGPTGYGEERRRTHRGETERGAVEVFVCSTAFTMHVVRAGPTLTYALDETTGEMMYDCFRSAGVRQ